VREGVWVAGKETKIFDPLDATTASGGSEVLDASVVKRGDRWWMFLAGQEHGYGAPQLYSASLAAGAPLGVQGWTLTRRATGELKPLAPPSATGRWDSGGGRHCPAFVKGWDPHRQRWVERIYYAGAAEHIGGPYTIGYLEWEGEGWTPQEKAVFAGVEQWEHGSVFEPNLIFHDGRWKMWYVAGSNAEDYLAHGYAESADGREWTVRQLFAPPEMRMYDFCVREREGGFDAVYARAWLKAGDPPPETGLWHCRAKSPSGVLAEWGEAQQLMGAENRGWHAGPWKPSVACEPEDAGQVLVFFDGMKRIEGGGPFPFVFTQGCLEVEAPGGC